MTTTTPAPSSFLEGLNDYDRKQIGEALRRLLAHGSIFGLESVETEIYHWCHQNSARIEEFCALLHLRLHWDHELRLVQVIPERGEFLLRLKLDATLVFLTLWYEFDTAVRDRGEAPPIRTSVQQTNDSLSIKFASLRRQLPSPTRMREILTLAQRKNLIRFEPAASFEQTQIDIFPTLKRIIPFQGIEDWARAVERLAPVGRSEDSAGDPDDNPEDGQ